MLVVAAAACRRGPREVYLTHLDRKHGVSLRYPSSWTTDTVDQAGNPSYRYFSAPGEKGSKEVPTSASLLFASAEGGLDALAASFLEGASVSSQDDIERQGVKGKAYRYTKGAARYGLVLLPAAGGLHGLYVQGDEAGFIRHRRHVDEVMSSFAVEQPEAYEEYRDADFAFSLRVPPSWKRTRRMSSAGTGTLMMQFLSPPSGLDRGGSTVHASLTVSVERAPGGGLEAFYQATRRKLGDAYKVTRHTDWRHGYLDNEVIETPMAMSNVRRFYRVAGDRGYTLVFEAREDIFHRVAGWFDLIAGTFVALPAGGS